MREIDGQTMVEHLITEYGKPVFSLCYAMTKDYQDAEDLAQDTFVCAYRALEGFDGEHEKAWLMRIAANKCLDFLKSASRRSEAPGDDALALFASSAPSPEEALEDGVAREQFLLLCRRLKEPYKTLAIRHFLRGEDAAALARRTGENPKTVYTRLYRARQMLKSLWKEFYHG